jgi:hypothetical protein
LELSTDRVIGTPKLPEIRENRGFKEDRPVIDGQGNHSKDPYIRALASCSWVTSGTLEEQE